MSPEEQLRIYEQDTNAEENIRKAITDAYGGLESEIDQVRMYENEQLPGFYNAFNGYGGGTGATDLSPTALLQRATGDVANLSTTAQVARDAFDIRRAGMEDLISSAYNQWQQGYAGAQNAYDRWWAQQQAEEERRRWEEQMALERARLARMGSGGTPGIVIPDNTPETPSEQAIMDAYRKWNEEVWNKGANDAYNNRTTSSTPASTSSGYFSPAPTATPAGTWSPTFNRLVDNFRGL
jgi:hypothetical protein